jgi:Helix-turn-helix domain of resolvase
MTPSQRQRTTNDLLHWRRSEVVKLLSQGLTIDKTAEILKVSPATVKRDHAYIRKNSKEVLRNYFVDTLPNEVLKNIARLTAVSDSAWAMAARAKENKHDKLEADALRLAKDAAKDITEIVTDNKSLIDAAYDVAIVKRDERQLYKLEQEEEEESAEEEEEVGEEEQDELLTENTGATTKADDPNRVF